MGYEHFHPQQLIAEYRNASQEERGQIMWELLARDDPAIPRLAHQFLRDAQQKPPPESDFTHWMAQARVLVYFKMVSGTQIYEDWRSPFIEDIKRDVATFLERNATVPRGFPINDNPRSEDPLEIIDEMRAGISGGVVWDCVDRAEAIELAIQDATSADVVLIAGKGHETYQEVNGQRHPFDDREVARSVLAKQAGHVEMRSST